MHPTQDLKLYCTHCDQVACHNCTILLHKGHKLDSIDNAKKYQINSLRETIEKSRKFQETIHNSILKSAETIAKIDRDADVVQVRNSILTENLFVCVTKPMPQKMCDCFFQNEMEMFIKDYFKALEAHKETLLHQIAKAKEAQSLTAKEQQAHLIKRANEMKQVNCFAQNLLDHGNDTEILTFIGILQKRFDLCEKPPNMLRIDPQNVKSMRFLRDVRAPTTPLHKDIPIYGFVNTQHTDQGPE